MTFENIKTLFENYNCTNLIVYNTDGTVHMYNLIGNDYNNEREDYNNEEELSEELAYNEKFTDDYISNNFKNIEHHHLRKIQKENNQIENIKYRNNYN